MADRVRIKNIYVRCFLAEFLGTMILVSVGCGVIAQFVLSKYEIGFPRGNIGTIHIGWGIAVIMGVTVSGGVSGGHINPAFSLVACLIKHITIRQLPCYWAGQYLGAFIGACNVYIIYYDRFQAFDTLRCSKDGSNCNVTGHDQASAGSFATYPSGDDVSTIQCFADQVFGTFLLILLALAIIDPKNFNVPKFYVPFIIGVVVMGIVASFEYNCGAALNPARDFGPRVFTALAGWGDYPFGARNGTYWLVPIFGPHLGGLIALVVYKLLIECHWPEEEKKDAFGILLEEKRHCKCCEHSPPDSTTAKSAD